MLKGGGRRHPHPPPCSCRQTEGHGEPAGGGHLSGHGAAEVAGAGLADRELPAVLLYPVHELGDILVHTVVQSLRAGQQQVSQNPPELGERVVKFHFLLFFLLFLHCATVNLLHVNAFFSLFFFFYVKIAIVKWLYFA